jgi:hypothetical protein
MEEIVESGDRNTLKYNIELHIGFTSAAPETISNCI